MDKTEQKGKPICRVVGIHKGYDSQIKMSRCAPITQNILSRINQWHSEMDKGDTMLKGGKRKRETNGSKIEIGEKIKFEKLMLWSEPVIKDGKFRILPRNDTSQCIGNNEFK